MEERQILVRRKSAIIKINNDLRELTRKVKYDKKCMQRSSDRAYITGKEISIKTNEEKINDLEKMKTEISEGLKDKEIEAKYNEQKAALSKQEQKQLEKEEHESELKELGKKQFNTYRDAEWREDKTERQKMKDVRYAEERFWSAVDSFPPNMKMELANKPNNYGIKWRGCIFYGEQPDDGSNTNIIVERHSGGISHIYVHAKEYYRLYIKERNGPKILQWERRRKENFSAPATIY